jgi:stress response protein SCP2
VPPGVTAVSIGFNWVQQRERAMDVDIGCLIVDSDLSVSDSVSIDKPRSSCGSIEQRMVDAEEEGFDPTAEDCKVVSISMSDIPASVSVLAFYVITGSSGSGSTGESLAGIGDISAHLFETDSKREVVMMDCVEAVCSYRPAPTLLLCMLQRRFTSTFIEAEAQEEGGGGEGAEHAENVEKIEKVEVGPWHFVNCCQPFSVPDLLESGVQLEEYLSTVHITEI